jgi:predicted enzyme related to lactoylglutathione lyase
MLNDAKLRTCQHPMPGRTESRMMTHLARVTLVVRDQDEALRFYTEALGFEKRADVRLGPMR